MAGGKERKKKGGSKTVTGRRAYRERKRTGKRTKGLRNKEWVRSVQTDQEGGRAETSNGLEDRDRGREKRAREQDRGGEKGKKGEPAGQGGIARNDWTGSGTEK